jgi:hypothetical protein
MRTRPVTVAETAVFMRQADALWTDDERFEFVDFMARKPEVGDPIPASVASARSGGVGAAAASERGAHHLLLSRPRNAALPADDLREGTAR